MIKTVTILLLCSIVIHSESRTATLLGEYDLSTSKNRLSQPLSIPQSIAINSKGELFIADSGNHKIRKLGADGQVSVVVGNSYEGDTTGDPLSSSLKVPLGITFNKKDELIIADTYNHKIKRLIAGKKLEIIAGTGEAGMSGDGIALEQNLNYPTDPIVYQEEIYFIDTRNHLIRKITKEGKLVTVLGNGTKRFRGHVELKIDQLKLFYPRAMAFDKNGLLYVADNNGTVIEQINFKKGRVRHIAGTGKVGLGQLIKIGWHPTETHIGIVNGIFIDQKNRLYFVSSTHNGIFFIERQRVELYAGDGNYQAFYQVGRGDKNDFNYPTDFIITPENVAYVVDKRNNYIHKIEKGISSVYIGLWEKRNNLSRLYYPTSIVTDQKGLYIADALNYRVLFADSSFKEVSVVSGTGVPGFFEGYSKDIVTQVNLGYINDMAICSDNLFLTDRFGDRIFKIGKERLTFNRISGKWLQEPLEIECYQKGVIIYSKKRQNLIWSDYNGKNQKILVDLSDYQPKKFVVDQKQIWFTDFKKKGVFLIENGTIKSICGGGETSALYDQPLSCSKIKFEKPVGIAYDAMGKTLYITDNHLSRLYRIKDQKATWIGGDGRRGFNHLKGLMNETSFYDPQSLIWYQGHLFMADSANHLLRRMIIEQPIEQKKEVRQVSVAEEKVEEKVGCDFSLRSDSARGILPWLLLLGAIFMSRRRYESHR